MSESEAPDTPENASIEAQQAGKGTPAAKPGVSPLRIILFAILGIVIVLFIVDRMGQGKAEEAAAAVAEAADNDENLTTADVQELMGRKPDQEGPVKSFWVEEYRWQGGLRKHKVYVKYGDEKVFMSVSVNLPVK